MADTRGHFFDGASGIIFDCDGTLLDTMPLWNQAEAKLFAQLDRPLTDQEMNEVRAAPIEEGARILHENHGLRESTQAVLDYFDDMLLGSYRDCALAKPGVADLLTLIDEAGIPCAVVTSSPLRYVQAGLDHAGIAHYFGAIVTTDEAKCSKQDGRIYQLALDAIGASKQQAWGVDDALYAVKAMGAFGLRTIGVFDCEETATFEGLQAHATKAVRSLEELL